MIVRFSSSNLYAVGRPPFVVGDDAVAAVLAFRLADLDADDAAVARRLRPEIDALDPFDLLFDLDPIGDDVAVTEPAGFLMDVVGLFARLGLLHRPGARDRDAVGGVERPEVRLGHVRPDVIARDQRVADAEVDVVLGRLDVYAGRLRRREERPRPPAPPPRPPTPPFAAFSWSFSGAKPRRRRRPPASLY